MFQPQPPPPTTPPKPLRTARIIMWIQAAATALLMVLVFLEVASIEEHGQEMSGLGRFVVVYDPIVFVLGVIAAIVVASRRPWARPLAAVVEALAILSGIINITSGTPTGIVAIGLAIWVLALLFRPAVGAWLDQRPGVPAAAGYVTPDAGPPARPDGHL